MSPVSVSFEFFPPADDAAAHQLWTAVQRLAPLRPRFVSVTYGADGSTRNRTHECVRRIQSETHLTVAPHLTCVGASCEELTALAADYWRHGVRHVVALRGDQPAGGGVVSPATGGQGYAYASELVRGLKAVANFEITVAAYPEGHPESGTVAADLLNLQRKAAAGATRAITQFFFDNDVFLRYRDATAAANIAVKVVPGILPIVRFSQMARFAQRCGAAVPEWLQRRFAGIEDDALACREVAQAVAVEQVQRLRLHGVDEFHFYTLNRAELTYAVCKALGLSPVATAGAADAA